MEGNQEASKLMSPLSILSFKIDCVNEIQEDILKDMNEELKVIGPVVVENNCVDIETYCNIRDFITKYADIKQFKDKQDHRKRRRQFLSDKDMKSYRSEIVKFMGIELKSHEIIFNFTLAAFNLTSSQFSSSQSLHASSSSPSPSKVSAYTLPMPPISKDKALKALKLIEEERIKANEEGSLRMQAMLTPKAIQVQHHSEDEAEGEEEEEEEEEELENEDNGYRAGYEEVIDRIVVDSIIQDDVYAKYEVEEEQAIQVLYEE